MRERKPQTPLLLKPSKLDITMLYIMNLKPPKLVVPVCCDTGSFGSKDSDFEMQLMVTIYG